MMLRAIRLLSDMRLMFRWEHDSHTNIYRRGDTTLHKVDGMWRLDVPDLPARHFQDIVPAMRAEKAGEERFRMLASDWRYYAPCDAWTKKSSMILKENGGFTLVESRREDRWFSTFRGAVEAEME